jgi:hypothetical protein
LISEPSSSDTGQGEPPPIPPITNTTNSFSFPPPPKPKVNWLRVVLIVICAGIGLYIFGLYLPEQKIIRQKQEEARLLAEQKAAEEKERPHKEIQEWITQLRDKGAELPGCPLVFPLLNEKKKITPMGSYLSYLAMKRAAYLPEMVYRLPNAGEIFNDFALFDPENKPVQRVYRQELPFRFMAKDFGEGTYKKTSKGYQVSLRFWGTKPEKKFKKVFSKKDLHVIPNWMAECLHRWKGLELDQDQKTYLAKPTFPNDADFKIGVNTEKLIRTLPRAVCGWDKILADNPDNSFLFDHWLAILDNRESESHVALSQACFLKAPQDFFYRADYENELIIGKNYEMVLKLIFEDLMKDGNNSFWYDTAVKVLEEWDYYPEAIQLVQTWCDKHPDNQEAWMKLRDVYKDYAWEARGSGFANTVTREGWELMQERMVKAVEAANRAAAVAPSDCRVWSHLLGLGTGAQFKPEVMQGYFEKVLALNPYYYTPYQTYLNYLTPKWFGNEEVEWAFVHKYGDLFPLLGFQASSDSFWDKRDAKTIAEKEQQYKQFANNVKNSVHLEDFEKYMEKYLRDNPSDSFNVDYYYYCMDRIGQNQRALSFIKNIVPDIPEWKALYPYLVISAIHAEESWQVTPADREALENRPDVVRLTGETLKELVEMDPVNWAVWNQLAQFDIKQSRFSDAQKCFEVIGDHRVDIVWSSADFYKAKTLVTNKNVGPQAPKNK